MKREVLIKSGVLVAAFLVVLLGAQGASADRFQSTNYTIDAGVVGNSVGGTQTSTNYNLVSSGGESVVGNATGGSYKMGQGYVAQLDQSLELTLRGNDLVGYWPLDNSNYLNTAYDFSGYGNNGSYATWSASATGKVGNAWSDGGTNDTSAYMQVVHNSTLQADQKMTVAAWVYHTNSEQDSIASKWDYNPNDGSWAFQLTPDGTNLRTFIKAAGTDSGDNYVDTSGAAIATNTWYHVAMVYDGTQSNSNRVKMYLNGTLLSSTTTGTIATTMTPTTDNFTIGSFRGLGRIWSGHIDEVRLYNRALTQPELASQYADGNVGLVSGMNFNTLIPGVSQTSNIDALVTTDAPGYLLAINQNQNLTSGSYTIPAISAGTIGTPVAWNEGTTKGLGFTLYGTNATAISGGWGSGSNYAALPSSATTMYTRTGYTGGQQDILNMRLRLDIVNGQAAGIYTNVVTVTGTMTP